MKITHPIFHDIGGNSIPAGDYELTKHGIRGDEGEFPVSHNEKRQMVMGGAGHWYVLAARCEKAVRCIASLFNAEYECHRIFNEETRRTEYACDLDGYLFRVGPPEDLWKLLRSDLLKQL